MQFVVNYGHSESVRWMKFVSIVLVFPINYNWLATFLINLKGIVIKLQG